MAKILLIERDCGTLSRFTSPEQLNESFHNRIIEETSNNKAIFNGEYLLSGLVQRANTKNHNNRIYPYDELYREIARWNEIFANGGYMAGELDHTDDDYVRWERTSHRILKFWWVGNEVYGLFKILSEKHPFAARAQAIIDEFGHIGTSTRALGDLIYENGANKVANLEMITSDFVTEPSTHLSFVYPHHGEIKENINHILIDTLKPLILH